MRQFYKGRYSNWTATFYSDDSCKRVLKIGPDQHRSNLKYSASSRSVENSIDLPKLVPSNFIAGEFHPRIWRGEDTPTLAESGFQKEFVATVRISRIIFARLRELFTHIEPDHTNDGVYGIQGRELLILACTEVESAWKSVMKSNGYSAVDDRWKTQDYFTLNRQMRLNEWCVKLSAHPQYGVIRPFENWAATSPTQSIRWYDVYNAVKHDRESSLPKATFRWVIESTAALFVMIVAQFGEEHVDRLSAVQPDEFVTDSTPQWDLSELYIPPYVLAAPNQQPGSRMAIRHGFRKDCKF